MINIFDLKTMAIINILILSSSALAMQKSKAPRRRQQVTVAQQVPVAQQDPGLELKTQVIQNIKDAYSTKQVMDAARVLADVIVKFNLKWAWTLLHNLVESPGLNQFDSLQRAHKRNIGSLTLAYLNEVGLTRDFTLSLLEGPDLEENMAALRAISYGKKILECPWALGNPLPQAKAKDLSRWLVIIDAAPNGFISTNEIVSKTSVVPFFNLFR